MKKFKVTPNTMEILLSNDDGVLASGLAMLAKELSKIATIHVVAPDRNRSGASNSLTLDNPLRVKTLDNGFISVEGTPTDCVHLAITGLLEKQPDIVVAGVNAGANLGDDVLYSGTVAAATEGRFQGLPAIAVSLVGEHLHHYDTAARVARFLVERLLEHNLPVDTILNVNVPDLPMNEICGFEVTRLGTRRCAEPTLKTVDPRGHTIYWVGPPGAEQDAGVGTDFYAVSHKKVSITPLHVDLTHYQAFDQVSSWVGRLTLSKAFEGE